MSYFKAAVAMTALFATLPAGLLHAQAITLNFVGTETPDVFDPIIAAYEARNPMTSIQYQQIPFAAFNAQIEARVGSQDPSIDVYQADTPRVPTLAARGFLVDLEEFRDRIADIVTPTELSAVTYRDKIVAFPMWTGTQLLYYNRAMLDAAGIEYPSDDPAQRMTWDQVLDMARKAQKAGADYGFTYHQVDRYFQLQPLYESVGAGSGLTGDDLMTPDITNDKWQEVTQWYQDLYKSGLAPRGVSPSETPDMFINGQVPIIYGGLPLIRRFGGVEGLDFGVAPVPYFADGKVVTSTGSWAIGVSPYAQNRDAALDFAAFMTLDPEGVIINNETTSAVPVNKLAYKGYLIKLAGMSKGRGDAGVILTYEIENTAVPRPRSRGYVVFEEVMNTAFGDIRNGSNVADTLAATEARLRSTLARVQ